MKKSTFWGIWFLLTMVGVLATFLPKNLGTDLDLAYHIGGGADFSWAWIFVAMACLAQIVVLGMVVGYAPEDYLQALCIGLMAGFVGALLSGFFMFGFDFASHFDLFPAISTSAVYWADLGLTIYVANVAENHFKKPVRKKK